MLGSFVLEQMERRGVVCAYVPTNTAAMDAKGNWAFCLLLHILSTLVLPGLHAPTIESNPTHPHPLDQSRCHVEALHCN